jgi:hypothetical protein
MWNSGHKKYRSKEAGGGASPSTYLTDNVQYILYLHEVVCLDGLDDGDGHEGPTHSREEVAHLPHSEEEFRAAEPTEWPACNWT